MKTQLFLHRTSNKTLHEKTEDLCEALRICRSYYKTQVCLRVAVCVLLFACCCFHFLYDSVCFCMFLYVFNVFVYFCMLFLMFLYISVCFCIFLYVFVCLCMFLYVFVHKFFQTLKVFVSS